MEKYIINFSGHALSNKAKQELSKEFSEIDEVYTNTIVFNENVEEQIKELVRKVKVKLDGSVPISIVPPGHSTVAILLIAYLHGVIGSFPNICLLEENEDGFYLPSNIFTISSNKVKKAGRLFRQDLWNKNNDTPSV